jgi:hypothetical protein
MGSSGFTLKHFYLMFKLKVFCNVFFISKKKRKKILKNFNKCTKFEFINNQILM